jgi:dCTP deaminase
MIEPFSETKQIVNGKSWGLGPASYDIRIAHDLNLGPHPGHALMNFMRIERDANVALCMLHESPPEPNFALANTIENFAIPKDVAAYVCDKSTYARLHVSAFNTLLDPGFVGNLTLELVNLSDEGVFIQAGDPICQLVFHWLDAPTDRPYRGKYQGQPARPVGAILEADRGL